MYTYIDMYIIYAYAYTSSPIDIRVPADVLVTCQSGALGTDALSSRPVTEA